MKTLGDSLRGTLSYVREALRSSGVPTRTSEPDTNFIPLSSPYVVVNGSDTRSVFVYGISEYGGEDIIIGPQEQRFEKRYFLKID